jgi:exodeoxyribonuclease VII small subunit
MKAKGSKDVSYGAAAARLEEILQRIEEGKVDIDELSGLVGEAAGLVTLCRDKIQAAEIQVKTITEQLERETAVEPAPPPREDDDTVADDESARY